MERLEGLLKETWHFYKKTLGLVSRGSKIYYAWCFSLLAIIIVGFIFYWEQHEMGLIETNMTDQVSWGLYIANFTYLVGMAAAAVLLVIPSYIYQFKPIKEIVVLGELFAASCMVMAILFVMVDLGRLDRVWHMLPFVGSMNFPASLLAWDVLALNGYLFLNLLIPIYLLVKSYYGKEPNWKFILPFILLSIPWAVGIHTVTAFLYNGLAASDRLPSSSERFRGQGQGPTRPAPAESGGLSPSSAAGRPAGRPGAGSPAWPAPG